MSRFRRTLIVMLRNWGWKAWKNAMQGVIGWMTTVNQNREHREFPGGPVVRTQRFPRHGPRFDPWSKS